MSKKNTNPVTGFRYYFSMLAGVSRGPLDQIFQIMSASVVAWEGETSNGIMNNTNDPTGNATVFQASTGTSVAGGYWGGGPITETAFDVPINKPDLYGGDDREGGIVGTMDVYMGDRDQTLGDRIKELMSGINLSALRGVCTVFYDGEVCANNPYPKAWKFRVRRALKGWDGDVWYPERAVIMLSDPAIPNSIQTSTPGVISTTLTTGADGTTTSVQTTADGVQTITSVSGTGVVSNSTMVPQFRNQIYAMNPAHIIYECCTNRDWGRGLDRALMDEISFTDAANVLADEQFGLCMKWSRSEDIDSFIQTVLDHIGGVVYSDKLSGRLCLRLIRNTYDISQLTVFDYEHGLLSLTTVEDSAQDATANEVIVKYNSPVLDTDKEARAQNIASTTAVGSIFSVTRQYPGLPTSTLAVLVAQRDLYTMSAGLKRVTAKFDRRAYLLVPGDVIVINAPNEGLPNAVIRVAQIEDSTLSDGTITIMGAQDRFGLPLVPFIEHQPSTFQEPNLYPYPVEDQIANEASYRDLVKTQGQAFVDNNVAPYVGYAVLTAARPTYNSIAYDLRTKAAFDPDYSQGVTCRFVKLSRLASNIDQYATTFKITGDINPRTISIGDCLKLTGAGVADDEDEYLRLDAIDYDAFGNVVITVGRGCIDSRPLPHGAGSRIWAYDQTGMGDPTEYTFPETVGLIAVTKTSRGKLPVERATGAILGIFGRPFRTYPAADVRVNMLRGVFNYGTPPTVSGDLVITWKHRNRLTQADKLIDSDVGPVTEEDDTLYEIFILGGGGGFMADGAVDGMTYTVTAADLTANGIGPGEVTIQLTTYRNDGSNILANRSLVYHRFTWGGAATGGATGFGNNFGNRWGQ